MGTISLVLTAAVEGGSVLVSAAATRSVGGPVVRLGHASYSVLLSGSHGSEVVL